MIVFAVVLTLVFALATGFLGVLALRARRQDIPYQGPVGIPGDEVRRSVDAWNRGHLAAAPFVGAAAVISLLQTLGCAMAVAYPSLLTWTYLALLGGSGVILVGLLLYLAVRTGRRAA